MILSLAPAIFKWDWQIKNAICIIWTRRGSIGAETFYIRENTSGIFCKKKNEVRVTVCTDSFEYQFCSLITQLDNGRQRLFWLQIQMLNLAGEPDEYSLLLQNLWLGGEGKQSRPEILSFSSFSSFSTRIHNKRTNLIFHPNECKKVETSYLKMFEMVQTSVLNRLCGLFEKKSYVQGVQ